MAISEELELDISGALDAIESLNDSLTGLGESLTVTLTGAIEAVDVTPLVEQLADLDASGLTTTIDAAIDASEGVVPIDADTAAVPGEIDAAIDASDGVVSIEADTEAVPGEIDASIASADATVVLDADTEGFGGSIDEALNAADATVEVTGDASEVTSAIDEAVGAADTEVGLTAEADVGGFDEIDAAADQTTGKIEGIGTASTVAGGLATGNFNQVGSKLSGLLGPIGAVGAGIFGVITGIASVGVTAQAIFDRFRDSVGVFRDDVRGINVGSLDTDIGKLARKLGSTESALIGVNTNLFTYQKQTGLSGEVAAQFANNVTALAARAVALNPALGTVEDVAVAMQKSFAKSGKGAATFSLDLAKADIEARALANTGKASVAELTAQEKALAAAQLGAEKYGGSIDKEINKGSKNAAIEQRKVTAGIQDFLQEVGRPLAAPFLKILQSSLPIVKALAPIFADLGKDALPVLAQSLKDATPTIKFFGDLLRQLTPILGPLQKIINLTVNPLSALTEAFRSFGDLPDVAGFFTGIGDAITGFLGAVVGFGADLIDSFLVGIKQAFPAVVSFFANLGTTIFTTIGDVLTSITQKGTDIITGLFRGITTAVVAVFNFFRNLPGTIVNTIGDVLGALIQKGIDLISGLISGVTRKAEEVFAFFRSIPGRIVGAFGNVVSRLRQLGADIIGGLIKGIQSKTKSFFDQLTGLAKKGIRLITHPWEALSPSRVTLELGRNIGEGLALGIESQVANVEKAASALSAAATPALSALPAVAAALPVSAGSAAATTAGFTASAQADLQGAGSGVHIGQLVVQTTAPNQVQVGIEVARQLRAESFRVGR